MYVTSWMLELCFEKINVPENTFHFSLMLIVLASFLPFQYEMMLHMYVLIIDQMVPLSIRED